MPNPGVAVQVVTAIETVYGLRFPLGMRAWDGSRAGALKGPSPCCGRRGPCGSCCCGRGGPDWSRPTCPGTWTSTATSRSGCGTAGSSSPSPRVRGRRGRRTGRADRLLARTGSAAAAAAEGGGPTGRPPTSHRHTGRHLPVLRLLTSDGPEYHLSDAQHDKRTWCVRSWHGAGMRLLDVGCGWGSWCCTQPAD